jgi:hypothetical protein
VDDEAITLSASSPAALLKAIEVLMKSLVDTFVSFGFAINWSAGKTEGFVAFRGKGSAIQKRALFIDSDSKMKLPSNAGAANLRIVQHYKHLGSVIGCAGSSAADVPVRVRSAMASFAPLAIKVFGAISIARAVRLRLAHALVFSRLLYNVQTWSSQTPAMYKKLNHVYMRVLRRIAGACRFGKENTWSDREVRQVLGVSSLQVLIVRKRLLLLGSVLRNGSDALCSMLALVGPGADRPRLPWVRQLRSDLKALYRALMPKLGELGDPNDYAEPWFEFIKAYPLAWRELVSQYVIYCIGNDDSESHDKSLIPSPAEMTHVCDVCAAATGGRVAFASAKALLSHQRSKHQMRNPLRVFLDASGVCPVCDGQYGTRTRALSHASEARCRGKSKRTCRDELESGVFEPLPQDVVDALDNEDRLARSAARALGHTQPLARAPAKRSRVRAMRDCTARKRKVPCTEVPAFAPRPAKRLRTKVSSSQVEWIF